MGGHLHAAPGLTETKAVIGAGDALAVTRPHAERDTAMRAEILRHHDFLTRAIDHQRFVEQGRSGGCVADIAAKGDGIPEARQDGPVRGVEAALTRQLYRTLESF